MQRIILFRKATALIHDDDQDIELYSEGVILSSNPRLTCQEALFLLSPESHVLGKKRKETFHRVIYKIDIIMCFILYFFEHSSNWLIRRWGRL